MTSPDSTKHTGAALTSDRGGGAMAASRDVAWAYLRSLGCSYEEADDLAQEAVLVLANKQPEVDGDSGRASWIRQTAKHLFLTAARTSARRAELLRSHYEPEVRAREADAAWDRLDRGLDLEAAREALRECLSGLDVRSREICELFYRGELPASEIGRRLEMAEGAVHTALHRIRARLRACVKARIDT